MACLTRGPVFRKGALKPAMLLSGRPQAAASALREPPTLCQQQAVCQALQLRAGGQAGKQVRGDWVVDALQAHHRQRQPRHARQTGQQLPCSLLLSLTGMLLDPWLATS